MVKDIVVNLPLSGSDVVTPFAASVAGHFGAHLTGVAFVYEPVMPMVEIGAAVPQRLIDEQLAEARERAQAAADRFRFEVRGDDISTSIRQIEASPDSAPRKFAELARAFDMAIVGQVNREKDEGIEDLIAEAALFESGRPTLVVPYIQSKSFKLDRVAIAWDGSRVAARAIADALPMLDRAGKVHLLSIYGENTERKTFESAGMMDHLRRHGIEAVAKSMPMTVDVTSTILNFMADDDTDLLVMGGYGHSRLREFVLGGATRGILESMTVPTFMSH
jgi:nucleotide-binding universal stress UspA family protein